MNGSHTCNFHVTAHSIFTQALPNSPATPNCHFLLGWNNTESLQPSFDQRGKENGLEVTQQPHEGKSPTNLEQSLHTRDESHSTRVTVRIAEPCPPPHWQAPCSEVSRTEPEGAAPPHPTLSSTFLPPLSSEHTKPGKAGGAEV